MPPQLLSTTRVVPGVVRQIVTGRRHADILCRVNTRTGRHVTSGMPHVARCGNWERVPEVQSATCCILRTHMLLVRNMNKLVMMVERSIL